MKEITINIQGVIDISEISERFFFNWLRAKNIWWRICTNLRHIIIQEKDFSQIKERWDEINIAS
jgi:hypothetical protein